MHELGMRDTLMKVRRAQNAPSATQSQVQGLDDGENGFPSMDCAPNDSLVATASFNP